MNWKERVEKFFFRLAKLMMPAVKRAMDAVGRWRSR